ncbi:hypothetical protein M1146_03755 [Patescibacteria group bacterium]|nr:hypothetical protein [Patescibacteria group bacterium]
MKDKLNRVTKSKNVIKTGTIRTSEKRLKEDVMKRKKNDKTRTVLFLFRFSQNNSSYER